MTRVLLLMLLACIAVPAYADTRCARIAEDGTVAGYQTFTDFDLKIAGGEFCPPDIPHKGIKWLPAPLTAPPSFNPDTEVRGDAQVVVGKDAVTTTYEVRPKTAAELDGDKDAKLDSLGTFILKTLCDHENRVRVLERKSEITAAQCRAAIKAQM
jgi:hypothetical protein